MNLQRDRGRRGIHDPVWRLGTDRCERRRL